MSFANLNLITDGEGDQRSEYAFTELNSAFSDDVTKVNGEFPNKQSVQIDQLFGNSTDMKFISAKYQEDILVRSDLPSVKRVSATIVEQWLKYGICLVALNGRHINVIDIKDVSIYRQRFPIKKIESRDPSSLFIIRSKIDDEPHFFFTTNRLVRSILKNGKLHLLALNSPTWDYDGSIKRFESMVSYSQRILQLIEAHRDCAIKRDVLNSNAFVIANRKSYNPNENEINEKSFVNKNISVAKQFHNSDNMNLAIENTFVDADQVTQMSPYVVGVEPMQIMQGLQRELYSHFNFPSFFGGSENRERASSSQIQVEFQIQRYFKTIHLMSSLLKSFWAEVGVKVSLEKPVIQPSVVKMLENVISPEDSQEILSRWFKGI